MNNRESGKNIEYGYNNLREYWNIVKNKAGQMTKESLKKYYDSKEYNGKGKKAEVRRGKEINEEEKDIIEKRNKRIKKNIENILDKDIENVPKIGICASGGGCRAMLGTLGFLMGLEDIGVLDTVQYISSLSGSSWCIAPWISKEYRLIDLKQDLVKKLETNILTANLDYSDLLRKYAYEQPISMVDIYGLLLGNKLLENNYKLSYQKNIINNRFYPFPIYTSIIANNGLNLYEWMEYTPIEIGSRYMNSYIPTWSFNRYFEYGYSLRSIQEPSLSYLMGIWGSAFSANINEILSHLSNNLPQYIYNNLHYNAKTYNIGDYRFYPASVHNFSYNFDSPFSNDKYLTLIDAGLDFNLPLPPLLERNLDIIIVLDSSLYVDSSPELFKAQNYAISRHLPFPSVDYTRAGREIISVFHSPNAPTILYLPRIFNPHYSISYDPDQIISSGGYLNSFNFLYTPSQIDLLTGLTRFNAIQSQHFIYQIINNYT